MTTSAPTIAVTPRWKMPPSERMLLVAIVALLALRLVGLLNLPVFVDESIHMEWVRQTLAGEAVPDAFSVGKTLSIWLWAPFAALPVAPLLATRFASVLATTITTLCIVRLGNEFVSRRAGLVSALVFLLLPYTFFQGRMALVDNFVTALFALLMGLSARATRRPMGFGDVVTLTMAGTALGLSKLTGILALPVPLLAALLLSPPALRRLNLARSIIVVSLVSLIVLLFVVQGFGLGEFGQRVPGSPAQNIVVNLGRVAAYSWALLTPPTCLLALLAIVRALRQRVGLWLVIAALLMVLPYLPVANLLFSRYLMPALVPLSLLIGALLAGWLAQGFRWWQRLLVVLAAGWMLVVQLLMIVAIPSAPLPDEDTWQYVSGWPSGYGLQELAGELATRAARQSLQVIIVSRWDTTGMGLLPYADERLSLCLLDRSDCVTEPDRQTVVAVNRTQGAPLIEPLSRALEGREKVWSYTRPHGQSSLELWADPQ